MTTARLFAPQQPAVAAVEKRSPAIDFIDKLDPGELLTLIPVPPVVVDLRNTGDLTITNVAVNTADVPILNRNVPPGQAVQFQVAGFQDAAGEYLLEARVWTDRGNYLVGRIWIPVEAKPA